VSGWTAVCSHAGCWRAVAMVLDKIETNVFLGRWFETQSWYREERNVQFHVEKGRRLKRERGRGEEGFYSC
jgi:hypothetical protein